MGRGGFPSQRSLDENGGAGLEEERRLAYVGITRARKKVYISFTANRRIHGLWQSSIPSRFIGELPAEHIEEDMAQGLGLGRAEPVMLGDIGGRVGKPGYGPGWGRMAERQISRQQNSPMGAPQRDRDGWLPDKGRQIFKKGMRVFHQKFGMGSIELVDADKLEIAFDRAGLKKVVASFVTLPEDMD